MLPCWLAALDGLAPKPVHVTRSKIEAVERQLNKVSVVAIAYDGIMA